MGHVLVEQTLSSAHLKFKMSPVLFFKKYVKHTKISGFVRLHEEFKHDLTKKKMGFLSKRMYD